MLETIDTEVLKIVWAFFGIGLGWIFLRFLLKLARKIFTLGCFVIGVIGLMLIASQFLQGS